MKLLAIDIGSSSIKAALLDGRKTPEQVVRESFPTLHDGARAEVEERRIRIALARAIERLGAGARRVDRIVATGMAPSWAAMDRRGRAITPIVTHQDRRAIAEAKQIELSVGKSRHLRLAGNRPFPGGISSTTWRWFATHQKSVMRRADLVGHLSTWLCRQFCGVRVVDPSNAGFMGVYRTLTLGGWCDELIDAAGAKRSLLPEIKEAHEIAGRVTRAGASDFGLTEGTPVLTGCMDGSAAMLAAGEQVGQLLNVSGSTDVLALLVDHPKPHEQLLTRPLGIGRRWLAVATLASAGSSLDWARRQLFADLNDAGFQDLLARVSKKSSASSVRFSVDLAGSRTSMEERSGAITGLRLGSTREDILCALCKSLADAGAARVGLLQSRYGQILPTVVLSGGVPSHVSKVLRRDWPERKRWRFRSLQEATLRGLSRLVYAS